MGSKKNFKFIIFNAVIALIDILLFSDAFVGLNLFTGTAFSVAAAWGAVAASLVAFFGGNIMLLRKNDTRQLTKKIETLDECLDALEEAEHSSGVFNVDIENSIEQIKRFRRKKVTIDEVLLQKFSNSEMSYQKFAGVLSEVEKIIYINIRSILNKISAFDFRDYELVKKNPAQDRLSDQKMAIYMEYINFVKNSVTATDDILLKLDKMLLEISRYNTIEDIDIKQLPAIVEMDELIKNAQLYR